MVSSMEEALCRVEINRADGGDEFVAKVYSDHDGTREFRNANLELLLRELTMDLEYSYGEQGRGRTEAPTTFDEEAGFGAEEMY